MQGRRMSARNLGSLWTLEEEQRLYDATSKGASVREIAEAHGRTTGGIRSRQRQMGLTDDAGTLTSPTPEFRSALRTIKERKSRPERTRHSKRPTSSAPLASSCAPKEGSSVAPQAPPPWPEGFPHEADWIEKLWSAIRFDAEGMLRKAGTPAPMAKRALDIALARLTPDNDLHPAKTLSDMGVSYGVSRERIRQIQVGALRRLSRRVLQADSITKRVLDMMSKAVPDGPTQTLPAWFAIQLAEQACHRPFMEFALMAALGSGGAAPRDAQQQVDQAIKAIQSLHRSGRRRQRRGEIGEVSTRTKQADAFIVGILKKAKWPDRLNERSVDLSEIRPLRNCHYEKPYYSRTLKRLVGFDSLGERRLIRELDLCTMVTEFVEQPLEIGYEYDGRSHVYVPDLLVRIDADFFFVIEIKARQQLTDRRTMAKAEAAQRCLAGRSIGYCLTDSEGFGLSDLRAIEPDKGFSQELTGLLQRHGTVRRQTFEQAFGGEQERWAYDQLQATVLRGGLHYDTRLSERPDTPNSYVFDFRLRRVA